MNLLKWTSALVLLLVLAAPATAQRNRGGTARYGRNSTAMKKTLDVLAETSKQATCQVRDGKTDIVLGTVFSSDGWIVTKNSEVEYANDLKCVFENNTEYSAKVVATDKRYDLALLKVDAKNLVAVQLAEQPKDPDVGQIVVSCDEDGKSMSMGLITAKPRRFTTRQQRPSNSRGFLGVICRPSGEGLVVRTVTERSGADRAGLTRGDVILTMEGKEVKTTDRLIEILTKYQPKEKIQISINRGDDSLDLEAILGKRPNGESRNDKWGGGPFSDRRFGFPTVIPHDSAIRPEQCGGPLLNSDGQVIGLNIARAIRVATYAVPIKEVVKFVDQNRSSVETAK